MSWKTTIGKRLYLFRQLANQGKGFTHEDVAKTTEMTKAYIIRLENEMKTENPTFEVLEKLVTMYGQTIGELFRPVVEERRIPPQHQELFDKLEWILRDAPEDTRLGMIENIHAMFDRGRRLNRKKD